MPASTFEQSESHSRDEIFLNVGPWQARISTIGARLLDLAHGSNKIVEGSWPEAAEWFAGCTLAPWVNRLADGSWLDKSGVQHRAEVNDPDTNSANHGLVFNRDFAVVERSDSHAVLVASCRDASAYPFDVTVRVEYELTQEGLRSSLSTENHSIMEVPIAVGAHPYLVVDAESRLRVEAAQRVEVDARMLPAGLNQVENRLFEISPADRSDFTDACFTELNFASGWATTVLTRPSMQSEVVLAQSPELTHLQVFTLQGGYAGHDGLLALEPQTAAGNALNHLDRVPVLKPGETKISEWSISLRNSFHD